MNSMKHWLVPLSLLLLGSCLGQQELPCSNDASVIDSCRCTDDVQGVTWDFKGTPLSDLANPHSTLPFGYGRMKVALCGEMVCNNIFSNREDPASVMEMHTDEVTNGCNNVLGRWTNFSPPRWFAITPGTPGCIEEPCGIQLQLSGGSDGRSITFDFFCDSSASNSPVLSYSSLNLQFSATGNIPCKTYTGGGGGMSGGWVFIIILISFFFVYCVGGYAYKTKTAGTSGAESVPNVDFWRDLPALCTDGWHFTKSKLCGGGGSYDEFDEDAGDTAETTA